MIPNPYFSISFQKNALTVMVHDQRLAPLGTVRPGLVRRVGDGGIEHEIVDLICSQLLQRLPREPPHVAQAGQLERADGDGVGDAVVVEGGVGGLGALGVAGAEDEAVGLGLLEELLAGFEALEGREVLHVSGRASERGCVCMH